MMEQKWTLDVESNQYELIHGKLYLIGGTKHDISGKKFSDITLKSQTVDAKHCVLDATGTTLCIYDLHSELGTFLNGKRLDAMLKEFIHNDVEICIGEETARLHQLGNKEPCTQHNNSTTEIFLVPTQRAPRSSLSNTSTRLFSSPDVSMAESTIEDDSFNIPETQHVPKRASIGCNSSLKNISANQSIAEKINNDDSFIPETQMATTADETINKNTDNLIQQSLQQHTDELIRMCTQDFNENLFSEGVDDETFTSLIIPNIQHAPVILRHEPLNTMKKDISKASSGDAEMEALNWSAQTSKGATTDDSAQLTQCLERTNVCTPDLFDFPELAEINLQGDLGDEINKKPEESKAIEANVKTTEKYTLNENTPNVDDPIRDGTHTADGGDGYAEEIDMNPTQVFIPKPRPSVSNFVDLATQVFIPKPKQNEINLLVTNVTAAETTELSLSGKENIPHTDFSLEQTQIFPIATKDSTEVENKPKSVSSGGSKTPIETFDRDLSLLPPTQLFSSNSNNSMRHSKAILHSDASKDVNSSGKQHNLNSTLVPRVESEKAKSVASFFEEMDDTTDKASDVVENEPSCFKKPKQSTSSTKSTRSKETTSTNVINYTQSETEDFLLCTPKWICDNFDELTVEKNVDNAKKRMLFCSDSEDEPEAVDLNSLVTKKDSKDFERLLANVKDAKPPPKVVESPKNVLIKQEKSTETKQVDAKKNADNVTKKANVSKSDEKKSPNKEKPQLKSNITDKDSPSDKKNTPSSEKERKTRSNIVQSLDKGAKTNNINASPVEKAGKLDTTNAPSVRKVKSPHAEKVNAGSDNTDTQRNSRSTTKVQTTVEPSAEKAGKLDTKTAQSVQKVKSYNADKVNAGADNKDKQRSSRSTTKDQKIESSVQKRVNTKISPSVEKDKSANSEKANVDSNNKDTQLNNRRTIKDQKTEPKCLSSNAEKVSAGRERESAQPSSDNKDKKGTKRTIANDQKTVEPAKRVTRLRSKTSDLDAEIASNSNSAPSDAKKRRMQIKEESSETNKTRLTRARSKTGSQESIASTKSSSSTRSTKKVSNSVEAKEKLTRKDSSRDDSAGTSKSSKPSESKETRSLIKSETETKRKHSKDIVSSDAETKRLRSTTRTLQVAMSMVEPKLFQTLLDNSPGNWCLASDPINADVLVMDKGNRTLKFLIAMAKGIPIVTSKWLESLNATKTVPRGITHFFRDKDFEKRHKFSLLKSLELARKHKIFEGYDFLITPSVLPQPADMKQIIECAGGQVHEETPSQKPNQNLFVISSWSDKKHWHKYRRSNANIRITSGEGVMESVMRQMIEPLEIHVFV